MKPTNPIHAAALTVATLAVTMLAAALFTMPGGPHLQASALYGEPSGVEAADLCVGNRGVSDAECQVLVALYEATVGSQWDDNTHWLSGDPAITPCDWYGVTCRNGRVSELLLAGNGLHGKLPRELSALDHLQRLQLENNAIGGAVGSQICGLVDTVETANLDYNRIEATGNRSRSCLDQLDPGWSATQTVPPGDVVVASASGDTLDLTWAPIEYVEDGGHYAIAFSTSFDGPFTVHGRTADKRAGSYRLDGLDAGQTYYLRLRTYTPAHGNQPKDLWSDDAWTRAVTLSPKQVLLAVYFGADNDLDSYARPILQRLIEGTAANPNVTVVALIDRLGDGNTGVWTITDGVATTDQVFLEGLGVVEVDTADPDVMAAFLRHARNSVAADISIVSIVGHGVGLAPDLAWYPDGPPGSGPGAPLPGIPPLPRTKDSTPTDVTSGRYMSTPALGRALAAATDNGADPFDLIFFDQCFAGNLDVLYEVRNAAKVFVASPNYAWLAAPYGRYLAEFSPARSPEQIAEAIISVYQRSLNDRHPNAILAIRSEDISRVAAALDDLAVALMAALDDGRSGQIAAATINSDYADTTQCGRGNLSLGPPDELIGADSFAAGLQQSFGPGDAYGVHVAAGKLLTALDEVRSTFRVGHPYIEPDEFWDYDDTLTILAPLPRTTRADVAWRASIYADIAGEPAVWSPDPSQSVVIRAPFAYVAEGRWDEFIDAWYTGPSTPTVGQWCNYAPPSLVISDTVELLVLDVNEYEPSQVALGWTPALDGVPAEYLIYSRQPGDVSWRQLVVVAATETTFGIDDLAPGRHRFIVVAGDDAGVLFAKSETVDLEVSEAQKKIYLPAIWP